MSDPYLTANRVRKSGNATRAIAAHLDLDLDREGHAIIPPEGASLAETIAHLLHARHTRDAFGTWDVLTDEGRAWWVSVADDALFALPTSTVQDLAARLYDRLDERTGPWATLDRGGRAAWTITAQAVMRHARAAINPASTFELTYAERVALPAPYHQPVFDGLGVPHSWQCAVCWDAEEGIVTAWPCAPATTGGVELAAHLGLEAHR